MQAIEADMVAKQMATWSSGTMEISRRSRGWRRMASVDDAPVDSLREITRDRVNEVRKGELKGVGEEKRRGDAELNRKWRISPSTMAVRRG